MDTTKDLGGVQGTYSKAVTEELEREILFAYEAIRKGYKIEPEEVARINEMQIEMHIRQWVNGRANGTIHSDSPFAEN